ncbi:MAG: response regulator transcription factor [Nitrospirae bacterium]|nr:response regulator transcription factor [Nitrospirota bacterium]
MIPELQDVEQTGETKKQYILEEIYKLCDQIKINVDATNAIQKVSLNCKVLNDISGDPCSLRAFPIDERGGDISATRIMIFVERVTEKRTVDFEKAKKDYRLTKRELEVVTLIYQGLSNREISEKICVSEYTVKDHIKNVMKKMGVDSRSKISASLR